MSDAPTPALLRSLESATGSYPLERKLLVCPSMGTGRELLRALVALGRSWIGWQVTTPRRLAVDIAAPALVTDGFTIADAYEERSVVDAVLDECLTDPRFQRLRELGEAVGFRTAVNNSVGALRLAGVGPERLRGVPASNEAVRDILVSTLDGYTRRLAEDRLVDTAAVLDRAVALLGNHEHPLVGTRVFLLPGLSLRGRGGELVRALQSDGAVTLATDPVSGTDIPPVAWAAVDEPAPFSEVLAPDPSPASDRNDAPTLDLFRATGPTDELREVLRRVVGQGLRWDEVEIVATDPVVYGAAMHALSGRLGIPVSYGVGLPVERTRTGRATAAYFRWLAGGFPADTIRHLLESGDLAPPGMGDEAIGGALARRLRRLRIGWGRGRYLPAIDRALERLKGPVWQRRSESPEEAAERVDRDRGLLEGLCALLAPLLDATPDLDMTDREARVSPARLAMGLKVFLEMVPESDGPSATARRRLMGVADRVAATLTRETTPAAAVAILGEHLEIRVPAPDRDGSAPWVSSGGHVHLTDIEHGGFTGRRATFVVGLDADRFPGRGLQDPLLLDAQRVALDPSALPSSADRLMAARFRLAALLARVRGAVTLSYSAWDPSEARNVAPAAVLLQAFRLREGDPAATFSDLHEALGDAASAVPRGDTRLDGTDVWLDALDRGGIFRAGREVVRAAYPRLDAGLRARAALEHERPTEHHGLIRPRPELDPRNHEDMVLSASGIQALGACGLRYLYRSVLRIRPPEDPELDPDRWLDAMARGRLLHQVYERTLREAREAGLAVDDPAVLDLAESVLDQEAESMRREVPPPGEAVAERERTALLEDVRSFVHMVAERGAEWVELELKFGLAGRPPAALETAKGTVRLRGAIDRVDRHGPALRVIDYKTGRPDQFRTASGVFDGGRRLQNVIYSAVAESLMDGRVERMEYHFPTRRGENRVRGYDRTDLRRGLALLDRMFDLVAAGRFLPTDDPGDCRFCDYGPICRVRHHRFDYTAPMAEWAEKRASTAEEYEGLRGIRRFEEWVQAELEDHAET